ncbi:MAG: nucleotide exchange factor GrpE [Planctomycetota bacterium]|nr:nucleotide exchange factor GrpE [Planctomycetota bacterium]
MSDDANSVGASNNADENLDSVLDVTAEAMAEATEAISGTESENSVRPDSASAASGSGSTELATLQAERDQYFEQMKRAHAELENYRRRVQREAELSARYASLPLIRDLLPALDNVARTIQAAEQTGRLEDLIQGLQMIVAQFDQVFTSHSAKQISAVGETFDPNLHEALQQIPTNEHPPMTVLQELERGYILHDRVIRPAKVLVACALPEESSSASEQ